MTKILERQDTDSCFSLNAQLKEEMLYERIQYLTKWHYQRSQEYRAIIDSYGGLNAFKMLNDFPFVAVRLFKLYELKSIEHNEIFKVLTSSGTTSQLRSKIYLDKETAAQQAKALVKILQSFIGKKRIPMMFVDHTGLTSNRNNFSARGAGVQGLSIFGRDHTYILSQDMQLDMDKLQAFCKKYEDQSILIFGFTFMVWCHFLQQLEKNNIRVKLPKGILIHSGGWKKMHEQAVDNASFKRMVKDRLGISKVYNFYGMVEQTGSIFMECEQGHLHASDFGDVIIRDAQDWRVCETGEQGVIQVISTLPTSYPGHNLLSEDLGTLLGVDDCLCGRKGKYFSVDGRIAQAEQRGCSDVTNDVSSKLVGRSNG